METNGADGLVPDVVDCEDRAPGLCWPCLTDLLLVLMDVPFQLRDLDVGVAAELDGAAAARRSLVGSLEALAAWLEVTEDELPTGAAAAVLARWSGPPALSREMVLAEVLADCLHANVDEPELRTYARELTAASVRARDVIFFEETRS